MAVRCSINDRGVICCGTIALPSPPLPPPSFLQPILMSDDCCGCGICFLCVGCCGLVSAAFRFCGSSTAFKLCGCGSYPKQVDDDIDHMTFPDHNAPEYRGAAHHERSPSAQMQGTHGMEYQNGTATNLEPSSHVYPPQHVDRSPQDGHTRSPSQLSSSRIDSRPDHPRIDAAIPHLPSPYSPASPEARAGVPNETKSS
ncbi:hypothetical protein C8J57DRAFT_1318757 [Mycena rebaudengoi]|nr:hypothetical protein C8J57DRAFT_1318757 [Mycena rebaudengoi]